MGYVIGTVLSLAVAVFARRVGLDRDRTFYATVLIVVASYYVLFAAMSGSLSTVVVESLLMTGFALAAVAGFKRSTWLLVAGLAGHGIMDAFHGSLVHNTGVPVWWPAFCGSYDVGAALWLGWLTVRASRPVHRATR